MLKTTSLEDLCFGSWKLSRNYVGDLPDCLDSLTVCVHTLLAPAQFYIFKNLKM